MNEACRQATDDLMNHLGRVSETAGFGRMTGQIYSLLYLSPVQLSLGEIAEKLGVSKPSVSLNIQNMARIGMVKRYNRPADRRDYYEAESDFWKVMRGILHDREKKMIGEFRKMLSENIKAVKGTAGDKEASFYAERLKHMQDFLATCSRLLNAYLALEQFRISIPGKDTIAETDDTPEEE